MSYAAGAIAGSARVIRCTGGAAGNAFVTGACAIAFIGAGLVLCSVIAALPVIARVRIFGFFRSVWFWFWFGNCLFSIFLRFVIIVHFRRIWLCGLNYFFWQGTF